MAQLKYELVLGALELAKERKPDATVSDCLPIFHKMGFDIDRARLLTRIDQCAKLYQKKKDGGTIFDYEFPVLRDENLPRGRKAANMSREERRKNLEAFFKGIQDDLNADEPQA